MKKGQQPNEGISQIRSLIDMHSRLDEIPSVWLQSIEPKIIRGSFMPCWIWSGSIQSQTGLGLIYSPVNGKQMIVTRFVAEVFWEFPKERGKTFVYHSCHRPNCVNPNHLIVTRLPPVHFYSKFGKGGEDDEE